MAYFKLSYHHFLMVWIGNVEPSCIDLGQPGKVLLPSTPTVLRMSWPQLLASEMMKTGNCSDINRLEILLVLKLWTVQQFSFLRCWTLENLGTVKRAIVSFKHVISKNCSITVSKGILIKQEMLWKMLRNRTTYILNFSKQIWLKIIRDKPFISTYAEHGGTCL